MPVKRQITAADVDESGQVAALGAKCSPRSASSSSVGIPSSTSWKQDGKSKHRNEMRQRNGRGGQRWRGRKEEGREGGRRGEAKRETP